MEEIKETINQLNSLIEDRKSFLSNDKEANKIFEQDIKAIETIIKHCIGLAIENTKLLNYKFILDNAKKELKEKIKEIELKYEKMKVCWSGWSLEDVIKEKIFQETLELLKGDENE